MGLATVRPLATRAPPCHRGAPQITLSLWERVGVRVSRDGRVHLALALAVLEPVVTDGTQPSLYIP